MTTEQDVFQGMQPMTVDEAAERYHGKWILMQVTDVDDHNVPVRGRILAVGPTRRSIQPAVLAAAQASREAGTSYYTFWGRRRIGPGADWPSILDAMLQREMHSGRRR